MQHPPEGQAFERLWQVLQGVDAAKLTLPPGSLVYPPSADDLIRQLHEVSLVRHLDRLTGADFISPQTVTRVQRLNADAALSPQAWWAEFDAQITRFGNIEADLTDYETSGERTEALCCAAKRMPELISQAAERIRGGDPSLSALAALASFAGRSGDTGLLDPITRAWIDLVNSDDDWAAKWIRSGLDEFPPGAVIERFGVLTDDSGNWIPSYAADCLARFGIAAEGALCQLLVV